MKQPIRKILVVDDDVDACHNLSDILTDLDYEVTIAHSGPEALELVDGASFDLALLDLKMPGMDGLNLYRELRKRQPGTVAIIVTAHASKETAAAALDAGAWKVLSKPVDFSVLLPLVDEATSQPLVLIVDDDQDLCDTLWDVLRERGYRVSIAHDEQEAADSLETAEFKVILLDMKLPGNDGAVIFRYIRNVSPESRVVIITGYRNVLVQMIEQVLAEGADAICYKPFDMPQLLRAIDDLSQE